MNSKDQSAGQAPRGRSSLLALGSAAVLAVYAAGFLRTRAAAQRFGDDSEQRHPVATPVAAPADTPGVAHIDTAPAAPKKDRRVATVAVAPPKKTPVATPPVDSVVPIVTPPAVVPAPPPAPVPVPVVIDTAAAPVEKPVAKWKDGTYRGWGTSRHGDIEAAVDIKGGKIASAYITQCLTRYSCSWISHLQGQVVARQSADVDYVSGATQSSNAFYQAILEALTKAK